MPTLDSLPADRRAIIELVLRQAKPYGEIAELLDMPEGRVRAYARESLAELAPRSASRVEPEWRDRVADYLLGQLSGPDVAAVRGHIAASEPARTWGLSVVDSLGDLYAAGTEPEIPEPGATAPAAPAAAATPAAVKPPRAKPARPSGPLSPAAQSIVLRRRIAGAVAATLVIGLLAFFIGPGFHGKPAPSSAATGATPAAEAEAVPIGALELDPEPGETGKGVATFLTQNGLPGILIQAKLAPNGDNEAYEAWLYNDQDDAVSIGAAQTDEKGNYVGVGPLPTDINAYKYLDISREPIDKETAHSGDSVLRGSLDAVQPIDPAAAGAAAPGTPPDTSQPATEPPATP